MPSYWLAAWSTSVYKDPDHAADLPSVAGVVEGQRLGGVLDMALHERRELP